MKMRPPPLAGRMQPPLIPVIDVVFDLLIFFLLIPSVSTASGYLTTNLPSQGGPNPQGDLEDPVCVRIALLDEGPGSEKVSIVFNDKQELGTDFDALREGLVELRARGLSDRIPVRIEPTSGCRQKYVVQAFDAAAAAKFNTIQFAVPYE
jgi:biopolymer transport protein ExbD